MKYTVEHYAGRRMYRDVTEWDLHPSTTAYDPKGNAIMYAYLTTGAGWAYWTYTAADTLEDASIVTGFDTYEAARDAGLSALQDKGWTLA